jgi:hypothetical protein
MLKGKYVVLSLAAALVCMQLAGIETVNSGVVDPCKTTATAASGTSFACPQGDGDALSAAGLTITVTVRDNTNAPIPGVPASDFWLVGCNDRLVLCGGSGSMGATGATDANGVTTIAGDPAVGGCDTGVKVVVQGIVVQEPVNCTPLCLNIAIHTPDMKSAAGCAGDNICPDLLIGTSDFSYFSTGYATSANPTPAYKPCLDMAAPFAAPIALADFSKFSAHYLSAHKC